MATKRVVIWLAAMLVLAPASARADWARVVQACGNAAKQNKTPSTASSSDKQGPSIKDVNTRDGVAVISKFDKRYPWEDCILKFMGVDPVAPVVGNLGTGGGPAVGLRAEQEINSNRVQSLVAGRALVAPFSGSYIAEAHWDVMRPAFGQSNAVTATFEDQIIVSPFVRRTDLQAMPFYGLGPSTVQASKIEYRDQRTEAGVLGSVPLVSWLTAGGGVSFLAPAIDHATQPDFIDSQAFLRVHTPTSTRQTWHREEARITYESFADQGNGANTFHTVQLFALGSYELRRKMSDDEFFSEHRTAFQDFLCQPMVGQECRQGNFVVDALVTTSFVDAGRAIPFYLQPTLGGTDREGLDTLRGLDDFRLRAPNRMLLQAEFYKDVNAWFGLFVFADTGTVALNPGDLGSVRWHYDYGPGIFVRAGGRVALRAFLAFGGGEGVNASFKFAGGP